MPPDPMQHFNGDPPVVKLAALLICRVSMVAVVVIPSMFAAWKAGLFN
jgi:hypothetical protein